MNTFGIKETDFSGRIRFLVCEDALLRNWLYADNIERAGRYKALAVTAPEGYAFNHEKALVKLGLPNASSLAVLPHAGGLNMTQKQYLPNNQHPFLSKALMLMHRSANVFGEDTSVVRVVSAEDFDALNIDESHVISVDSRDF